MHKCPRQERRSWVPDDLVEVQCSGCGQTMEFLKGEARRKWRKCRRMVVNPKQQETE